MHDLLSITITLMYTGLSYRGLACNQNTTVEVQEDTGSKPTNLRYYRRLLCSFGLGRFMHVFFFLVLHFFLGLLLCLMHQIAKRARDSPRQRERGAHHPDLARAGHVHAQLKPTISNQVMVKM